MQATAAHAVIRAAYDAFNRRDIDAALAGMTPDVAWANGWEGGYVHGRDEVRAYWTRQWAQLDPRVTPLSVRTAADGRTMVAVEQRIFDRNGELLRASTVMHAYTFRDGLVARMEIVDE